MDMMKTIMFFSVLVIVLATSDVASGVPFDIIVPETIDIVSDGNNVGAAGPWGWLIATTDVIGLTDLEGVVLTGYVAGQSVAVSYQVFLNQADAAPLIPGEAAGTSTSGNAIFLNLLGSSEAIVNVPLWQLEFSFPAGYSGSTMFTGSISLGSDTVSYSTNLVFGNFQDTFLAMQAQRFSSSAVVPEPTSIFLLGTAFAGLVGIRHHRRRQ